MVAEVFYRHAEEADIPQLARYHRLMFEEMYASGLPNNNLPVDFEALERAQQAKLDQQLVDGSCVAWVAEYQGEPIAGGSVSMLNTVPVPEDPSFRVAFLHSVYTIKTMRGRGIATTIIERLLDHCRKYGLRRILLNASEAGRPIYQRIGFVSAKEAMILWL